MSTSAALDGQPDEWAGEPDAPVRSGALSGAGFDFGAYAVVAVASAVAAVVAWLVGLLAWPLAG